MITARNLIDRHGIACFAIIAIALGIGAALALEAHHPPSLLDTANKLGPAAQSLIEGRGLAICYGAGEYATCFHAERMPVAPLVIAALHLLFHDHRFPAALLKTMLFLLPVLLMFVLAWRNSQQSPRWIRHAVFGIFFAALVLPPTLDLMANLNFEEGYLYSFLGLAIALLLFADQARRRPLLWATSLTLCCAISYLTKSSMLPVAAFLVVSAAAYAIRSLGRPPLAAYILLCFAAVPLGWGLYAQHSSGRFTLGTSLDGVNLYKGNNPWFAAGYPAFRGASLDDFEALLFAGQFSLKDEWSQNDFGLAASKAFLRNHPAEAMSNTLRKASVFFLGVRNSSDETYNPLVEVGFTAGLVIFRVILLAAIALAIKQLLQPDARRFPAFIFLGSVCCIALPYVAGFALTRHATVLILPGAAYLARVLGDEAPTGHRHVKSNETPSLSKLGNRSA